jgi:tripartite-type tricarboxylate transporter receptor subunit TctC
MIKTLLAAVSALILNLADQAVAEDWPQKPIRIIVSFGPGGGADIFGRILADSMQVKLGKPVVVENKPGARHYWQRGGRKCGS